MLTPETLAQAMGNTLSLDRYRELFQPMVEAMQAAQINTVNRAAAWCSQIGHESAGLKYMAEIQTSSPTWNADRTRYRGRGPIQLTWEGNYRKFGQWCALRGYTTDPEQFVKQPELVEQPRWGFLASSWYWLNGGPRAGQINAFADRGDILAVSRCINGWFENRQPNGMPDRQARWDKCLALGDAIVPTGNPTQENSMAISGDPVWLEDVLREAIGNRLVVEPDWKERGAGGTMGVIWGSMWHHTGNVNERVEIIRDGVQQPSGWLPGPLSQGLIKPDGTCHLIAVGPCNHAGGGNWKDLTDGNRQAIGFECAYNGSGPWPQKQIITMRDIAAAISKHIGKKAADSVCGHKEYAKPQGRKVDPGNMDMDWFRAEVQKDLDGFVFPGEATTTVPPVPDPVKPNYEKETWDQLRIAWPQLGGRTLVDWAGAVGEKLGIPGCYDTKKPSA